MRNSNRNHRIAVCALGVAALAGVVLAGCTYPIETPGVPHIYTDYLCDVYEDYFSIGAAVTPSNVLKYDEAGLMRNFNSITAENDMKWRAIEPAEGEFSFGGGDSLVSWAEEHNTAVRGHCLLWYKSLPAWLTQKTLTKTEALEIIDRHVTETVKHFGDSIYVWDVCNEILANYITDAQLAAGKIWRTDVSGEGIVDWYKICGTDFVKEAFRAAGEAREELGADFQLFYNDYSLNNPNKRQAVVELVNLLREDNIPIDGIGMQAHYRLPSYESNPALFLKNFEDSIRTFTEMGLNVHITELDIAIYASTSDPQAFEDLPYEREQAQAKMYADLFAVCRKYAKPLQEGYGAVTNVTTWGVADDHTYATTSIHREYPLIFGRDLKGKQAFDSIIDFV